jgi:hypothetical protein
MPEPERKLLRLRPARTRARALELVQALARGAAPPAPARELGCLQHQVLAEGH